MSFLCKNHIKKPNPIYNQLLVLRLLHVVTYCYAGNRKRKSIVCP